MGRRKPPSQINVRLIPDFKTADFREPLDFERLPAVTLMSMSRVDDYLKADRRHGIIFVHTDQVHGPLTGADYHETAIWNKNDGDAVELWESDYIPLTGEDRQLHRTWTEAIY